MLSCYYIVGPVTKYLFFVENRTSECRPNRTLKDLSTGATRTVCTVLNSRQSTLLFL